ncbi:MAG: MFS transporter [Candidatus Portnoybacteria bacterium]
MNKIISFLILSDIALVGGFGFIAPIFAIFLTERIEGGNIEVAGYAAAVYWIVKSLIVIPIGRYLDKNHGEKDDFWFIVIGNILASLVVFGYIFSRLPWHIYVLEGLYAVGAAMNIPAYTAVFTRHIDKGKEASDWGIRSSLIGLGAGASGALGGIIANKFGFDALFIGVGIFVLLSAALPFFIKREFFSSDGRAPRTPEIKIDQMPELKE